MDMPAALGGDAVAAAARVLLGYAVVLAMPGPNALAIGTVAALRGFAGAVPLCLGVACGVGTLAAFLCLAASGAPPELGHWDDAGRVAGGMLLLYLALRLFRRGGSTAGGGDNRLVGFCGGFCTAVSNPITAAFFASQFVGLIGASSGRASGVLVVLGAAGAALAHGLVLAGALAWSSASARIST
jgi:threonine/homoserine/homoserine lactone efflux protein